VAVYHVQVHSGAFRALGVAFSTRRAYPWLALTPYNGGLHGRDIPIGGAEPGASETPDPLKGRSTEYEHPSRVRDRMPCSLGWIT
jgi:hypothetical protein